MFKSFKVNNFKFSLPEKGTIQALYSVCTPLNRHNEFRNPLCQALSLNCTSDVFVEPTKKKIL
jgi:hypothetical protein